MADAKRDDNFVPTLLGVSSADDSTPVRVYADPTTHRLLVDIGGVASAITTDSFSSTNNQTIFNASGTVVGTIYLSINGLIQTPTTDYTTTATVAVLAAGIPASQAVVWVYVTS